jgi:dihydroflavonol-4-reductase
MKILVTGANGFIGSFIIEHALQHGFEVWAGVRETSNKSWLTDSKIHFIDIDLFDEARLQDSLLKFRQKEGSWDYVVHAAGITKAADEKEFLAVNYEGTCHLVNALKELSMVPQRFIFLSSLSVLGPLKEQPALQPDGAFYAPLTATDTPHPNTAYAMSKLQAENYLLSLKDFPFVILRPTGVYGPREKDYFLLAKSIKRHIDFAVGLHPQEITFIYVRDLVQAVFLALDHGKNGNIYLLSDGRTYNSRSFSDLLQQEMGVKNVVHFKAPLFLLRLACTIGEISSKLSGNVSTLNNDKYHILKQRNWRCDIQPARQILGFQPVFDLERGVKETVAWYRKQQWI